MREGDAFRLLPRRLVASGLLAAALAVMQSAQAAEPLGPAPRSADGRFENPDGPIVHAGPRVTFPFFLRRIAGNFRRPRGLPEQVAFEADRLLVKGFAAGAIVTWVGHSTLLVQMDGVRFLTDPTWSGRAGPGGIVGARRWSPPAFPLDALPDLDFVLVSHNHYDHLDLPTLERLAARHRRARFFVPLGNADLLRRSGIERVTELDWGEHFDLAGVRIHCTPARHWSRRGLFDERRGLWSSWAVTGPTRRFFFAGDSSAFDGFQRIGRVLGPFDLAAVPIGAYEPQAMMRGSHVDPEQAVTAGIAVAAERLLAIHYGTFDVSDEPVDEPPRRFRTAAQAAGLTEDRAWTLRFGETRPF